MRFAAGGVHPSTGARIPADSPYNHPEIIRALYTCINQVKATPKKPFKVSSEEKQKENLAGGKPRFAGCPWTGDQKERLGSLFQAGVKPPEIARQLERTTGAIVAELNKEGLMTQEEAAAYSKPRA